VTLHIQHPTGVFRDAVHSNLNNTKKTILLEHLKDRRGLQISSKVFLKKSRARGVHSYTVLIPYINSVFSLFFTPATVHSMEVSFFDLQLPALLGKLTRDTAKRGQAVGASVTSDSVTSTHGSAGRHLMKQTRLSYMIVFCGG
jgi:hypothetical protein